MAARDWASQSPVRIVESNGRGIPSAASSAMARFSVSTSSWPDRRPLTILTLPSGENLQGLRALIVDDNETNRKVLHRRLDRWGVVIWRLPTVPTRWTPSGPQMPPTVLRARVARHANAGNGRIDGCGCPPDRQTAPPAAAGHADSMGDQLNPAECARHGWKPAS